MNETVKVLFSLCLYPTVTFVLLLVLLLNEIVRWTLGIILCLQYGKNVFLMDEGADAVWEYRGSEIPNTRMVLVCLVTKRGQLETARNCAKILDDSIFKVDNSTGAGPYIKLQNIVGQHYGYTCWRRDKSFQVKRHFRTLDRDFEYNERDLINLLSTLTHDMDDSKPQWEWVMLPKYTDAKGKKKSLQIFRFHHAYMDGMSGLMLISKMSDNFKFILDPLRFKTPIWKKIYFYVNCTLFAPITLFRMYKNKYSNYWNRRRLTRSNHSGRKFMAWTNTPIPLDLLQRIRFDTKASIPTIVSFAFVEACRNVLPKKRLVKEMRVSEVIAFFPYPNSDPQNRFTAFTYSIGVENADIPMFDRLRITQRNSIGGIGGPEPLVIYYIAKIAGRFPCRILPYVFNGANSSMHLSNIPCAKEGFKYFGAECEEFWAFPPLPNDTGICISSLSYKGGLRICGQADPSCLSQNELHQIFRELPNIIYSIANCTARSESTSSPNESVSSDSDIMPSSSWRQSQELKPPRHGRDIGRKSPMSQTRRRKKILDRSK